MKILIRGKLFPSNSEAVAEMSKMLVKPQLYYAYNANRVSQLLVLTDNWEQEGIEIGHCKEVDGTRQDALNIIEAFNNLIKSRLGTALNLYGHINIIVETDTEPYMFSVTIKDLTVTYQEANYGWTDQKTYQS